MVRFERKLESLHRQTLDPAILPCLFQTAAQPRSRPEIARCAVSTGLEPFGDERIDVCWLDLVQPQLPDVLNPLASRGFVLCNAARLFGALPGSDEGQDVHR